MSIDLFAIWDNLGSILLAVVLVLTFKATVTGVLLRLMGARRSTAAETGILMASPSETTLIVLAAAGSAMLIQPGTAQFWQIVTAIGLTVTPILARLGRAIARQVEPVPELDTTLPSEPPVIIIGADRVGLWWPLCSPRMASPMSRLKPTPIRSGERSVGYAGVSTGISRGAP